MFPPRDLTNYLKERRLLSKSRSEIEYIISQDSSLDEDTKKRWLKYYKKEFWAELVFGVLTGNSISDDDE